MSERVIQSDLRSARKPFRFKSDCGRGPMLLIAPTDHRTSESSTFTPFSNTIYPERCRNPRALGRSKFVGLKNYHEIILRSSRSGSLTINTLYYMLADRAGGRVSWR